jgi:hypothetical protein
MPNTKAVGVAYSDPEFESVTVTGAATAASLAATGAVTAASLTATGNVIADNTVAVTAGGTAAFLATTTANLGVFIGSGAPTVSAAQGSLYLRTDGSSTSTRLYVNTNGTTGWTNVTTAT